MTFQERRHRRTHHTAHGNIKEGKEKDRRDHEALALQFQFIGKRIRLFRSALFLLAFQKAFVTRRFYGMKDRGFDPRLPRHLHGVGEKVHGDICHAVDLRHLSFHGGGTCGAGHAFYAIFSFHSASFLIQRMTVSSYRTDLLGLCQAVTDRRSSSMFFSSSVVSFTSVQIPSAVVKR